MKRCGDPAEGLASDRHGNCVVNEGQTGRLERPRGMHAVRATQTVVDMDGLLGRSRLRDIAFTSRRSLCR